MRKYTGRLIALAVVCMSLIAIGRAAEESLKPDALPKAVAAAIKARFPDAEITAAAKETENGQVVFDIELKQKGRKFESDIKEDGTILEIEKEIAAKDWPKPLSAAVDAKYPKSAIKEVMEVNKVSGKEEKLDHLEVTIELADHNSKEVLASLDGKSITEEAAEEAASNNDSKGSWTADFSIEKGELASTGRNPYFILEPGYQLVYKDGSEQLVITVLNETKVVDGVETRVVEENETKDGQPVEISRNYFAISKRTNSVFYFGEDVDIYESGKVTGHGGGWLSGVNGAKFGLAMPGLILLHARYQQEVAPGVAMDRAEIVSDSETVKTPAGEFKNCVKIEETSPLEPAAKEYKIYAPGVGQIQDDSLKLVKYGKAEKATR